MGTIATLERMFWFDDPDKPMKTIQPIKPLTHACATASMDPRLRCCVNFRHYIPPHNMSILDGAPSSYCGHPSRAGARYTCHVTSDTKLELFREPGERCDELFEGKCEDKRNEKPWFHLTKFSSMITNNKAMV